MKFINKANELLKRIFDALVLAVKSLLNVVFCFGGILYLCLFFISFYGAYTTQKYTLATLDELAENIYSLGQVYNHNAAKASPACLFVDKTDKERLSRDINYNISAVGSKFSYQTSRNINEFICWDPSSEGVDNSLENSKKIKEQEAQILQSIKIEKQNWAGFTGYIKEYGRQIFMDDKRAPMPSGKMQC